MSLVRWTISGTKEIHDRLIAKAIAAGLSLSGFMLKQCGEEPLKPGRRWPTPPALNKKEKGAK